MVVDVWKKYGKVEGVGKDMRIHDMEILPMASFLATACEGSAVGHRHPMLGQ
jgi:hypothetical protein